MAGETQKKPVTYAIVIDTNCLQQGAEDDFSCSWIEKSLASCCDIIESRDAHELFKFLIPEVVSREIRSHQLERHKASVEKIQRIVLPMWSFEYNKEDYKEFLDKRLEGLYRNGKLGMVGVEVVAIPEKNCLGRLVDRALEKRPPFSGEKKESDKGFKDAIIWESILEYKETHKDESIILASGDGLLGCDRLKEEFKSRFSDDLIVVKNMRDLENLVNELIGKLNLGFPSPAFADESTRLEAILKDWLFQNLDLLIDRVDINIFGSIQVETMVDYLEIDEEDGGFKARAAMRFENEYNEVDEQILSLSGYADSEFGWVLAELGIDAERFDFDVPLGFFGSEESVEGKI